MHSSAPKPMHPHPNSPTHRPASWRLYVRLPSILAPSVAIRIDELGRETFSQHAIETVCFDLRIRRNHAVTAQWSADFSSIKDAVDRFIVAHYHKGMPRDGGTLRKIIFGTLPPITEAPVLIDSGTPAKHEVFFPPLLVEFIEERWKELGLTCLSDYVVSVMRYDLLLGGKHVHFGPSDCTAEMIAALDRETLAEYLQNRKPKIKLDYLLEEAAGRELTREECEILLAAVGKKIRALAIEHYLKF